MDSPVIQDDTAIKYFTRSMLVWYEQNGRHFPWRNKSATQYQKIVSEVLLQRTRAETVVKYFYSFIKRYPSWYSISHSTDEELGTFLRPLGLWKRRASSLLRLSNVMCRRNNRFPKKRQDIEQLANVGQYIANAILLFCHNEPQPLLDVNMARILERFFGPRKLADIRYDPYLQKLSRRVIDCDEPVLVNWAILDYSAMVCKANRPLCDLCVIQNRCRYFSCVKKTKRDLK